LVMLCATQGVNGGGWAHYVGQEKCRPIEGWQTLAFAKDWQAPPRQHNATSWFYFATEQWKYEESSVESLRAETGGKLRYSHQTDLHAHDASLGWLPAYPQFDMSSQSCYQEAKKPGDTSDETVRQ